jgi:hypothetical protein
MIDRTQRRIAGYLLGGIVAGGVVIGLMTAIYPYAQEAYGNITAERSLTPLS